MMLMTCGISSSLTLRSNPPTLVMRGSSSVAHMGPVCASASSIIVRNLMTSKSLPCLPTRS